MLGGGGIMMALPMTRLAGLLIMFSNVQASDIADGSTNHGKFMAHHLNRMEHGGRPEALSNHHGLVEDASAPVGSSHRYGKLEGNGFSPIAAAVAVLSLAVMVGVRMRRLMQPAIAIAGSSDMSLPLATLSSADINSSFVRWDPIGLGEGAPKAHVRNFRERELQHGQAATIAVFFVSAAAVRDADLTVVAGRNDKRTKKGKIYAHSNGKSRPRKSNKKGEAPDPYSTLREWGKRQDPPMSVEEVVAQRVSELRKVEVTNADILDAITPF